MGAVGAASTATVSVLANRLHRMALKATRWAVARVQGMTADIGGRRWSSRHEVQLQEIRGCLCQHASIPHVLRLSICFRLTTTFFTSNLASCPAIVRIHVSFST
jgi:hypothetical protein